MCGIVGYIGKKHPKRILLDGLACLEYRGYDSAGIAFKNDDIIQIIKSTGKIANLEERIRSSHVINCNMGIAHTRWATHGVPNEVNAHPHTIGKVTLVHNGIIENASALKEKLIHEGVIFNSNTDTEVAAAFIDYHYDGDPVSAIEKAISEFHGSYAFAILFQDSDKLYAVRKGSPLIIGIGEEEFFIASDMTAIIHYTKQYLLLEENEVAVLSRSEVKVYSSGEQVEKEIFVTDMAAQVNDKNGYDHYMLKEMMEEPVVLRKMMFPFLQDLSLLPDLTDYQEIHIVACGSAMYAGMVGKFLLEEKAHIPVVCECASEYRYKSIFYDRKTLVLLISQSGETADTIAAMRKAKEQGIDTLAIVNVRNSTIARESDKQIFIEAGPEIAVATTKAYLLQVAILSLLCYKVAVSKGIVEEDVIAQGRILPQMVDAILSRRDDYVKIAKEIYQNEDIFFIGRKIDYAICLEGSLKLKEVSYIHSEAYQAGELKHGTISLITDGMPVFAVITDDMIKDKTISNLEEVKSRGAKVVVVGVEKIDGCDLDVIVPKICDYFQPILIVPVLQFIAYEVALLRGCDIDQPKNLAKSVTVE